MVNCFRDRWWVKWQSNGWKNSKKEPVANTDLWKPLIELVKERQPAFRWVKGHSGDAMNDLVDRLAVVEAATAASAPRSSSVAEARAVDGPPSPDQTSLFD